MSDHARRDNGTLRGTIREAASRLGVTEAAVRKRIRRGAPDKELGQDGRVYAYLDSSQDTSHPESQVHRKAVVEELVEGLRDRVAFLERSPELMRSVEAERYQQIDAGLTQTNNNLYARVLELGVPADTPAPYQPSEEPREGPRRARVNPPGSWRAPRELRTALDVCPPDTLFHHDRRRNHAREPRPCP